jgi:hypothetical protein
MKDLPSLMYLSLLAKNQRAIFKIRRTSISFWSFLVSLWPWTWIWNVSVLRRLSYQEETKTNGSFLTANFMDSAFSIWVSLHIAMEKKVFHNSTVNVQHHNQTNSIHQCFLTHSPHKSLKHQIKIQVVWQQFERQRIHCTLLGKKMSETASIFS